MRGIVSLCYGAVCQQQLGSLSLMNRLTAVALPNNIMLSSTRRIAGWIAEVLTHLGDSAVEQRVLHRLDRAGRQPLAQPRGLGEHGPHRMLIVLQRAREFALKSQLYWFLDTGAGVAVLFMSAIVMLVGVVVARVADRHEGAGGKAVRRGTLIAARRAQCCAGNAGYVGRDPVGGSAGEGGGGGVSAGGGESTPDRGHGAGVGEAAGRAGCGVSDRGVKV